MALRILYVGQLDPGMTCYQRMLAMRDLGHEVHPLDMLDYTSRGGRIARALRHRLGVGPGIGPLNRALVNITADFRPDLIWIDKGVYFWPASLSAAKRSSGARLLHYNPDDPFGHDRRGWRLFRATLPTYDLHLVPRDVNVEEYKAAGAKRVLRFHWAFDSAVHRPIELSPEERKQIGGAVGFVGHFERERARSMQSLAEAGTPVRIWGPGWDAFASPHPLLQIERKAIWGEGYTKTVCAFDINLGFLRKSNRDLSTTRSVEIPACGAFMLAERTEEHQQLFKEGEEAEFFADDSELVEKTRFYLAHPEKRVAIARRGRERCLSGGYSNRGRMEQMIAAVCGLGESSFEQG